MSCGRTIRVSTETIIPTSNSAFVHRGAARFVGLIETVSGMFQRRRELPDLLELDDRMLADVGLTRAEAEQLLRKPFWK